MPLIRFAVLLLLLSAFCASADAQTAYVTDELRLGVHRAPDTSDTAFTFLQSADSVVILQRNTFYARVRIPDGREGWVRRTFLVDEPPAKLRVQTVEKERDAVTSELKALKVKVGEQTSRHQRSRESSQLESGRRRIGSRRTHEIARRQCRFE